MNYQKGAVVPILILIVLVVAVLIAVYLVKNPQVLRSRASVNPISFIVSGASCDPGLGKCETFSDEIKISLSSPLGPPAKSVSEKPAELDISKLKSIYNTKSGQTNFDARYDLNSDGEINSFDYYSLVVQKVQNQIAPSQPGTISFKISEDPVSLDQSALQPYDNEPKIVDYKFKDKTYGPKIIWVEFIAPDGTKDKRSATVNYLKKEEMTSTPTPSATQAVPSPTTTSLPSATPSVSPAQTQLLPGGNPVTITPPPSINQNSSQTNSFFGSGN